MTDMAEFSLEPISADDVKAAGEIAVAQVLRNLPDFTYRMQNHSSVGGFYPACDNVQWTCGFWPGEVWLAYEWTGNETFRHAAQIMVQSFLHRIENKIEVDHHDMGFLYSPSCVAAWKLVNDEDGRKAAILAADQLIARYHEVGQFIQAWGAMGESENYRYIIDCPSESAVALLGFARNRPCQICGHRPRSRSNNAEAFNPSGLFHLSHLLHGP